MFILALYPRNIVSYLGCAVCQCSRPGISPTVQKGTMDNRILELALETLIARKTAIEVEIAEIRSELGGRGSAVKSRRRVLPQSRRRRARTPAERKAQSERMKIYWANKRAEAGKSGGPGAKTAKRSKAGK